MRIYLAVVIALSLGSCDEDNKSSATSSDDYSLTISDIPESLDDGTLSDLKVTLKRGNETIEDGALAEASIALAISCSIKDSKDKVAINKVVEADDGVAEFGNIKVTEGICKHGEYNCSLSVSLTINNEKIEKTANFVIDVKEDEVSEQCQQEAGKDRDESDVGQPPAKPAEAGALFNITGKTGDRVELRNKTPQQPDQHCQAILLQETMTGGELAIKQLEIEIDSDGNANNLFIVGNVTNCQLHAGSNSINRKFNSTEENSGAEISIHSSDDADTHVKVKLGADPNGNQADPTVEALFISQGLTYSRPTTNLSWSKRWQKSDSTYTYDGSSITSDVAWQNPYTDAMAVVKVAGIWSAIGLIVPTATLQIDGKITAGQEFAVKGRDGGVLSLADKSGNTCGASLYRLDGSFFSDTIEGIYMQGGETSTGGLFIAGDPSNCQLMVGVEKVAGRLVAIPEKENAEIADRANKDVEVILGAAPADGITISELFVQLKTGNNAWGSAINGRRKKGSTDITFNWGTRKQRTYALWENNTIARALIKTSGGMWYSIGY